MDWMHGLIDYGIIGILVSMSVLAVAVAIERRYCYKRIKIKNFTNKHELELQLTRRLHLIATVGSNAPYVGLLGTVLGIMVTFASIGRQGITNPGEIMTSLALALKATAAGIATAIPAVVLYNVLLRSAKEMLLEWERDNGR